MLLHAAYMHAAYAVLTNSHRLRVPPRMGAGWPADKQTRIEQYMPGPSHPYFTLETMYCPPLPATYWHWATGF